MSEDLETTETTDEKLTKPWQFVKGDDPRRNLEGRPVGAKNKFSFVKYWQERWDKRPDEFKELAESFLQDEKLRGLIIQMIDGRPTQDITTKGEKLPMPIYVSGNNSSQEDQPAQEEN